MLKLRFGLLICWGIFMVVLCVACAQAPKMKLTEQVAIPLLNYLYEREQQYYAEHGKYSGDARELGLVVPDSAYYSWGSVVNQFNQVVTHYIIDKATGNYWGIYCDGEITFTLGGKS
jgi:hypothetical protein